MSEGLQTCADNGCARCRVVKIIDSVYLDCQNWQKTSLNLHYSQFGSMNKTFHLWTISVPCWLVNEQDKARLRKRFCRSGNNADASLFFSICSFARWLYQLKGDKERTYILANTKNPVLVQSPMSLVSHVFQAGAEFCISGLSLLHRKTTGPYSLGYWVAPSIFSFYSVVVHIHSVSVCSADTLKNCFIFHFLLRCRIFS